jgi:hypothetical protein
MIEKIIIPFILFQVLSPGVFTTLKTSVQDVLINALIFIGSYWAIARILGITLTKADLIVPAVLFLILSPGLLLTLPPGSGGVLRSGQTSILAIVTHAIVFALIFTLLRKNFPKVY